MKLFCFGLGYSAARLASRLTGREGASVAGTRTRVTGAEGPIALATFRGDSRSEAVAQLLAGATHVLVSIPPDLEGCPALRCFGADLAALPSLKWIGYLSTIGVYGDHGGAWIDEDTPATPISQRSMQRLRAEQGWAAFGARTGVQVQSFRLPGIYGPGRSVIDTLKAGTAKRVVKPGQVFNRIHVDDIASALLAAMDMPSRYGIFNLTDDEPCPADEVVAYGAELLGIAPPPAVPFDAQRLGPMAASFYAECKRVRNTRMTSALGVRLAYPTYRQGLQAILLQS